MRLNLLKTVPVGAIALVLSLGLHGLLLGLPLPERDAVSEQTEPEASESLEPIAIRAAVPPVASPKPTILPTPQLTPKAIPKPAPQAVAPQFPAGIIVRSVPQAVPVPAIVPSPSPVPSPAATPIPASPSPELSPSPMLSPTPSPMLSPTPSPDAFTANFPHFENAHAGCFGLETCHHIEGEVSFREIGRTMMAQLEAKGYTVRLRDDLEDDTGRKVYEVSKDDETQYLSVLSGLELGRTVYVLAAKPMTIEDLQSGNVGGTPEG